MTLWRFLLLGLFLLNLSGCAATSPVKFVSTGDPVSDVLLNSMITEGLAEVGAVVMQEIMAGRDGRIFAMLDTDSQGCTRLKYDPELHYNLCDD